MGKLRFALVLLQKKVLSDNSVILSSILGVSALYAQSKSATTTLNIKLQPIQTIIVNGSQTVVDIVYNTKNKYNNGVSVTEIDHLEVFSTGGFTVSVKSDGNFKNTNGEEFIDAKDVLVSATQGSTNPSDESSTTYAPATGLKTSSNNLITSQGGRDLTFNVTYNNAAGKNDKYINKYIARDGTESVYTATVTYTIAAQ